MIRVRVNPDEKIANEVREAVLINHGFCPCEIEHKPENKCMCEAFRTSDKLGLCHCGLYERYDDGQ